MNDRIPLTRLLVANRGEIAVRVLRAAADLGIETVAVHTSDEPDAPHSDLADQKILLPGIGSAAYLDAAGIVAAARESGADAVHPGYGFLSENADFAQACQDAGLRFIGPSAGILRTFGNKTSARALAAELGLPVIRATDGITDLAQATDFLESFGPGGAVMVKALAGGGGRGMRPVRSPQDLPEAMRRCRSEAQQAFGDDRIYLEQLLSRPRHVEVQIVGDGTGAVSSLGERDCSVQRRRQKMIEIAPSPWIAAELRERLTDAAVAVGEAVRYQGVGTVEFLVTGDEFSFLEVNPRLQVEHTVTEEVTGIDLVNTALEIAGGATLAELGLDRPLVRGLSLQARVNAETLLADGSVHPGVGALTRFAPPSGRSVRVDTHCRPGYVVGPQFDPLLAKVVVTEPGGDLGLLLRRAERALGEFVVEGPNTTIAVLRRLLAHPALREGGAHTGFVDDVLADVLDEVELPPDDQDGDKLVAPLGGVIVDIEAVEGTAVAAGGSLLVIESMKMEHVVAAATDGVLGTVSVAIGDVVSEGTVLAQFTESTIESGPRAAVEGSDPDHIRPDLAETLARHHIGTDEARPAAVQRRRRTEHRTARENIDDLCDAGSFVEYGALTVAAQRQRRSMAELIERTPADGMVTGIGSIDGVRCVVMSYDYTVLAGTQGHQNHRKTDRMLDLAERGELPIVLFAEGGGGRPGDTDTAGVAALDVSTFHSFARLSGSVPLVGIVSGRCFAGNAALAGCCDVLISTEDASLGMGGPAMIEGGGLGAVAADDVGPMSAQVPNGVVDVLVPDEAEAVRTARRYLRYFRDPASDSTASVAEPADQRAMRHLVPENRLRVYDVRTVIDTLADTGSVLELRPRFGIGIITALADIDGRPVGLLSNDPRHLGGAIDAPAADKASRFLQLCDAFGIPVVSLCDTPGFMVGEESERTATVRHFSRMFVAGANLSVPVFLVVLRKAYGLGAMAMSGGSLKIPFAAMAWPSGEFGGMGLEGAVDLGYRKELDALSDPAARQERRSELIASLYEKGKGLSTAAAFEIDDVIDPADTRARLLSGLATAPRRTGSRRTFVDTW